MVLGARKAKKTRNDCDLTDSQLKNMTDAQWKAMEEAWQQFLNTSKRASHRQRNNDFFFQCEKTTET